MQPSLLRDGISQGSQHLIHLWYRYQDMQGHSGVIHCTAMFVRFACPAVPDTATEAPPVSLATVPIVHNTIIQTLKRVRWSGPSGDVLRCMDSTGQPQRSGEEGKDDQRQWPWNTFFESTVGCIDHRPAFPEYTSTPREQKEQ